MKSAFRRICNAPATARRVLGVRAPSLWKPTVAAALDAHPIRSAPSAQSVLRPQPAAGREDCRRRWIESCSLPIRCGAIRFKAATSQRINATYNSACCGRGTWNRAEGRRREPLERGHRRARAADRRFAEVCPQAVPECTRAGTLCRQASETPQASLQRPREVFKTHGIRPSEGKIREIPGMAGIKWEFGLTTLQRAV